MNIDILGLTKQSARSKVKLVWRLPENVFKYILGSFVLFFGLSAANAFGGWLQLVFYGYCLLVALTNRHRIPMTDILVAFGCGLLAMLVNLRVELSFAPFIRFVRPFVEGYLLAIVLYSICRIRTFRSLAIVLAGYVLLEFISFDTMLVLPDIRALLIELWYSDETYQQVVFQKALLFRGYGISRHHLFGLPVAMGTVSALLLVAGSLSSAIKWKIYFIGTAFCGILVVLLNARIGLMPVILCYVLGVSIFFNRYYLKQLLILIFLVLPAMYFIMQALLGDALNIFSDWLLEGAVQFFDPNAAADSNTVSDLSRMFFLPSDFLSWLFGVGRLCNYEDACYSDIGWIRLLQEGGLSLVFAVSAMYIRAIFLACSKFSFTELNLEIDSIISIRRLLFCLFIITFIGATIKGDSYGANEFSRFIMMLGVLSSLVRPNAHQQNFR